MDTKALDIPVTTVRVVKIVFLQGGRYTAVINLFGAGCILAPELVLEKVYVMVVQQD